MKAVTCLCMLVLLVPLSSSQQYLTDPSFENPVPPNWQPYGLGYYPSTFQKVDGLQSICTNSSVLNSTFGGYKWLWIGQTPPTTVRYSGWSSSSTTVSGPSDSNYGIYSDVEYLDGSAQYGVTTPFAAGDPHSWQFQCDTIITDKQIATLTVYPMFRNHAGHVCFDLFSISEYTLPVPTVSSTNPLKILFPLYIYPGSAWDDIRAQASVVPITVIANPGSGPGTVRDPNYVTYINKFVGNTPPVTVLGYVHTGYGSLPLSAVQSDILTWKSFYPQINGIFLDEASTSLDDLTYYQSLSTFIKTTFGSTAQVFLNPGQSTSENYTAFADSIMFSEGDYGNFSLAPSSRPSLPSGWPVAPCYSPYSPSWKYKSNAAVYGVNSGQYQTVVDSAISKGFGYVFVTDATLPNPYGTMPSYWSALVSYIASKNV